uniref:Protein YIPF n=1 Tax=Macrostomum lignano TaxID=282301 RepID=A0A1I8H6X8_9PLAT
MATDNKQFVMEFHDSPSASAAPLEGDMSNSGPSNVPNVPLNGSNLYPSTLDEPVKDTILRDVKAVGVKFYHVFIPRSSKSLLRDWDLWGPLILCTFLATLLQGHSSAGSNDGGPQFAQVFIVFWVGACAVTLNAKLLGGYLRTWLLRTALLLSLIGCRIILLASRSLVLFIVRCCLVLLGLSWSVFASTAFLASSQPPNRKALAVYPVCLFYFVISWMILSHSG